MDLDMDASNLDEVPIKFADYNLTDLTVFQVGPDTEVTALADPVYEQFLADVWVGIVLTLMVLSCVCFMCSCLIYHKFQEWKHRVAETRNTSNLESGLSEADLPSYTIASGLPTYEEALEQMKKVKNGIDRKPPTVHHETEPAENRRMVPTTDQGDQGSTGSVATLSVFNLFGIYQKCGTSKPA